MPCSPEIISQNCWLYMRRTKERARERERETKIGKIENYWQLLNISDFLCSFCELFYPLFFSSFLAFFFCALWSSHRTSLVARRLCDFSNHDIWLHRWLRAGACSKTQWNGKLEDCLEQTFHFTVHEINESNILDSSKIWRWKILIENYELWTSAVATTGRFCIIDTMHRALSRWNELSESISNGINQWKLITDILHHTTEPSSSS